MSWKRPGMFWNSTFTWIRMIDSTGKLWLRIFSLLFIVPMICTGCIRNVESNPEMAEEEARQDLIHIMGTYEGIYKGADKGESVNVVLEDDVIQDIHLK